MIFLTTTAIGLGLLSGVLFLGLSITGFLLFKKVKGEENAKDKLHEAENKLASLGDSSTLSKFKDLSLKYGEKFSEYLENAEEVQKYGERVRELEGFKDKLESLTNEFGGSESISRRLRSFRSLEESEADEISRLRREYGGFSRIDELLRNVGQLQDLRRELEVSKGYQESLEALNREFGSLEFIKDRLSSCSTITKNELADIEYLRSEHGSLSRIKEVLQGYSDYDELKRGTEELSREVQSLSVSKESLDSLVNEFGGVELIKSKLRSSRDISPEELVEAMELKSSYGNFRKISSLLSDHSDYEDVKRSLTECNAEIERLSRSERELEGLKGVYGNLEVIKEGLEKLRGLMNDYGSVEKIRDRLMGFDGVSLDYVREAQAFEASHGKFVKVEETLNRYSDYDRLTLELDSAKSKILELEERDKEWMEFHDGKTLDYVRREKQAWFEQQELVDTDASKAGRKLEDEVKRLLEGCFLGVKDVRFNYQDSIKNDSEDGSKRMDFYMSILREGTEVSRIVIECKNRKPGSKESGKIPPDYYRQLVNYSRETEANYAILVTTIPFKDAEKCGIMLVENWKNEFKMDRHVNDPEIFVTTPSALRFLLLILCHISRTYEHREDLSLREHMVKFTDSSVYSLLRDVYNDFMELKVQNDRKTKTISIMSDNVKRLGGNIRTINKVITEENKILGKFETKFSEINSYAALQASDDKFLSLPESPEEIEVEEEETEE